MYVGDGVSARRRGAEGIQELPCPSPERCEYGRAGGCKLFGRLNVQIEGQEDELATFIFRTTGYNSIRTLTARLAYFNAVSDGLLKFMPLLLRLRAKSTTLSHRTPVYYADLTLRERQTLAEAVSAARQLAQQQAESGVNTERLEEAARLAIANGCFEESDDEVPDVLEEFYPEAANKESFEAPPPSSETPIQRSGLSRRLLKTNAAN